MRREPFWRVRLGNAILLAALVVAGCSSSTPSGVADGPERLPLTEIKSSPPAFGSVEEMAAAAEVVAVGEVVSRESIGTIPNDEDPQPSEWAVLEIALDEIVSGNDDLDVVTVIWETYSTDGKGTRLFEYSHNGVSNPEVGDRYLWFLVPERENRRELFGNRSTHLMIYPTGVMALNGDKVETEYRGGSEIGRALNDMTIADVKAKLDGS